jgi:hypothetical protein
MMQPLRSLKTLAVGLLILTSVQVTKSADVTDITGDVGTPQDGSLVISGGTSGAIFDSTTTTITESFNFLSLPVTTSTNGQILIGGEPVLHSFAPGSQNFFAGSSAGNFTLTGGNNSGFGGSALNGLTSGSDNTGIGHAALINLTDGQSNTVVGSDAGTGIVNGGSNILIGTGAGGAYTSSESHNIIVGTANPGINGESNVIRIGGGGQQQDCFVDGIYASIIDIQTLLPVFIDAGSKLGTIPSAFRFKNWIKPIGKDSAPIMDFKTVSFVLKTDPSNTKQYGLIAEEVNKKMPELVVKDKDGNPFSVRYDELSVLVLNEVQKMADHIEKLEARIKKLEQNCR